MLRTALWICLWIGVAAAAPVGSGDSVIRIGGLCPSAGAAPLLPEGCTVSVSREQFETLIRVLAPNRPPTAEMKARLAKTYAESLTLENAAKEFGIDQSPEYRETMRWLQVKTLADLFRHRLEQESAAKDAEIEAYYREHTAEFEEARLRRLVLPKNSFATVDRQNFLNDARRAAGELRARAARGEDLERLQQEGYTDLGFTGLPPATLVGARRRRDLPSEVSDEVFSLRPGAVSKVEEETYSFVIYRLEGKRTLPLEQVKDEISREVLNAKLDRALKSVAAEVRTELDQDYFRPQPEP